MDVGVKHIYQSFPQTRSTVTKYNQTELGTSIWYIELFHAVLQSTIYSLPVYIVPGILCVQALSAPVSINRQNYLEVLC